jgi:hypothetical protein
MKEDEISRDQGLRLALQRRNEAAGRMMLSEDFADRLMQRIDAQKTKPRHRRTWLYAAIGAVAACMLLLVHHINNNEEAKMECSLAVQKAALRDVTMNAEKENKLPVVMAETSVAVEPKQERAERQTRPRGKASAAKRKSRSDEHITKLLDDADKAFWQATVQCAMDIEETFLQDEKQEETEYETEIVI